MRGSRDDDCRPFPGAIGSQEREFFGHPVPRLFHRRGIAAISHCRPSLRFAKVRLHPDHGVEQAAHLPPCGADAFDDHHRGVRRHVNVASAAAARPRLWAARTNSPAGEGSSADWVHNVLASGDALLQTRGRKVRMIYPRLVHDETRRLMPPFLRRTGVDPGSPGLRRLARASDDRHVRYGGALAVMGWHLVAALVPHVRWKEDTASHLRGKRSKAPCYSGLRSIVWPTT